MAKVLAANGIAQSLSFMSERKYLNGISGSSMLLSLELATKRSDLPAAPYWIKISQVGKPVENSAEQCFTAIQKILTACHLPSKTQLIFLVNGKDGVFEMYLGIRSNRKDQVDATFADSLNDFIKGIWPGMKCQRVKGNVDTIRKSIDSQYDCIDALTGIPSMETQYKTVYPATIDMLLAGMQKKNFTYMVIADPIEEADVDAMLYQVRDFGGQAESLKSFNYSENKSSSVSVALSKSKSICDGTSESKQEKSKWGMVGAGLMLASAMFPPAGVLTTALAIADGANTIAGSNLLAEFSPSKTTGISHSETTTEGRTDTTSDTSGQAISSNIVNKQIEAVGEHLFYHAKRLESGKALGCWSVGVYLMAETPHDIQAASMQLKSIASGQESIFEPVRIHHIEDVLGNYLPQTLGNMSTPVIRIKDASGSYFEHPLGRHFSDLRTVLTTKELSYFVNFPLRSVPGISVVDSSPEFSLNAPETISDREEIALGKLLYGGSTTSIPYHLPSALLAKHTLLCGINGTGKTNTVQAILGGIGNVPFLVIEPAKTEYVDWAIEHNKRHPERPVKIFIPGCSSYRDRRTGEPVTTERLRLNPFKPVWITEQQTPNVLSHIDRLKSTFAAAFPMYDILPVLLEDLVYSLYQSPTTNWIGKDANPQFGKTLPPTLTGMALQVDKVIEAHGYEKRVGDNMKACLNTRIASLRRGWKKDMLDTLHSIAFNELFDQPCVINLSYVGDDIDKSFFMSVILQFLYEYRTAQAEAGLIDFNANDCRHLTVIEEAHRVMQKCDKVDEPQYKTAMMFSNMLSEIRAYGEGMFLVDQVPTRLIPDAIKNTNTKITHRLVSEDDCKAVAESMGLSKEQRLILPKLLVGQCVVTTSLSTDKYWIKVNKMK